MTISPQNGTAARATGCIRWRALPWALGAAACLALYAFLRIRWVGHLLTWDEAMDLLTVRAFVSRGHDTYAEWFWRHPPLYCLLMSLLQPLRTGFAERVETMNVLLGMVNAALLGWLALRLWGRRAALWSLFMVAVLPASMFFDVWVKRDHPVLTFALPALLCLLSRRCLAAAVLLGLALLCKLTAVFYWGAALLLWAAGAAGPRRLRDAVALAVVPALASGWWYLIVSPLNAAARSGAPHGSPGWAALSPANLVYLLRFATSGENVWRQPWHYYLSELPGALGYAGLALAAGGAALLLWAGLSRKEDGTTFRAKGAIAGAWPLAVLAPSYLLLSLLPSKVLWVPIVLYPAWAAAQAVAAAAAVAAAGRLAPRLPQVARGLAASAIALAMLVPALRMDYAATLERAGLGRAEAWSRAAAEAVNAHVRDTDRFLVTSFHYWSGQRAQACPIFVYYLERRPETLVRSHRATFAQLVDDVRKFRIDWVLASPAPGAAASDVLGGFTRSLGLPPIPCGRACLFHTSGIAAAAAGANAPEQKP